MDEKINKILQGDCLIKLKELEDNSVDSIVTDPPYELGFMGKSWDNTGIANNKKMWAECLRVLKPGGHLLAFSGTRTYHRMASAIEDAGFEVRDMIEWVYASGFPKSLNIGKAVDKLQGNEREVVGENKARVINGGAGKTAAEPGSIIEYTQLKATKGTSEWEGWGTALKPAHEPICMARKPLAEKTVAENCLKYGTGGINIDESRVATDENRSRDNSKCKPDQFFSGKQRINQVIDNSGRFPANLIHDNSEEVRECFPESKSSDAIRRHNQSKNTGAENGASCYGKYNDCDTTGYSDSGNASRFFKSIIYQAKASKSERNYGLDELPDRKSELNSGGIGRECSVEKKTSDGSENAPVMKNHHPTVKPIALMEYLIKMITPKGGIVLDPFAGSGSTLVAAKENGFQYIGIEMTEEYIPIIEARLSAVNQKLI